MTVSRGNLDSLLNLSFDAARFSGMNIQSWTTLPGRSTFPVAIDSITVTMTGLSAPGHSASENLKVVSVDEAMDRITFDVSGPGYTYQMTDWVIGYGPSSLLLSLEPLTAIELEVDNPSGLQTTVDAVTGVLSSVPLAAGTEITFPVQGTSLITPGPEAISIYDLTTNEPIIVDPEPYTGPVVGVNNVYISTTHDSLAITATTPGWFIRTGDGLNAITASSGVNVLDSGTGSAFMTGGSGTDLFFVHADGLTENAWSTANQFDPGDSLRFWGVTADDFSLNWLDDQGAAGFTGLTLTVAAPGHPVAGVTLSGFTMADLSNGRLSVSYGDDGSGGAPYLSIREVR
jgi:hypothetical protein